MKEIAIGIDIGGTNTTFGLIDRKGNSLGEGYISTNSYSDIKIFLTTLYDKINITILKVKEGLKIKGIGIVAPMGNYKKGTIEYAANLPWKGIIPLAETFEKISRKPVLVTNDANAAAIGEMIFGGAKGMKDFIMITLGTGLGGGVVANGDLVYGQNGFAGEIGHITVNPEGRDCNCGKRGCLETYVSATGIKRTVFELLARSNEKSELRDLSYDEMDAIRIHEVAKRGDRIALDAFDYTGKILGKVLADCISFSNPQAIFFFGGLANAGEYIFKPTRQYMEQNLLENYKDKVKLLPSKLEGAHAAILGASALVWKELDK
jgi:glucokinase